MLNLFKKHQTPQTKSEATATFSINGMHCTSCSMNIDGELEDTAGVFKANTNYAQGKTIIVYDPAQVQPEKLKRVIESLEYGATLIS